MTWFEIFILIGVIISLSFIIAGCIMPSGYSSKWWY